MSAIGVPVFTPIPPGFDVKQLAEEPGSHFHLATRVDARTLTPDTAEQFDEIYRSQVLQIGEPLVIENWHLKSRWPGHIFKDEWLDNNLGRQRVQIRDLVKGTDDEWSLGWYLSKCGILASKFNSENYKSFKRQRLYLKDMDCPSIWMKNLGDILPRGTFYLDENADLMAALPEELRAVNMMCYVGHEGTFTPCHKEMCSSIGQNIMVSASENGKSIWFLVKPNDRAKLAVWFRSVLGQDLELENYFASIEDWKKAPVDVWIVEQRVGDFLIIPPASPHQVWNQGDLTIKAAWNRCTPESLRVCLSGELSMSKFACREEAYKVKTMVYMAMLKIANELNETPSSEDEGIVRDFLTLYPLFEAIMLDEAFSPELPVPAVEDVRAEFGITCSFCSGNIFNRFLSCPTCPIGNGDNADCYDICMDCYTLGRRCKCDTPPKWVQQYPWATLRNDHERFRQIFNRLVEGQQFSSIFKRVGVARSTKESLDHLASAENVTRRSRAWVSQILSDLYTRYPGQRRKGARAIKDAAKDEVDNKANCHVCKNPHAPIIYVECSNERCNKRYCYGYLWRAHSQNPYMILSSMNWRCPFCLKQCTCAACLKSGRNGRKARRNNPIWLGYNTRAVTDQRSEEWLTTFAQHNKKWATSSGDGDGASQKRKRSDGSGEDSDADIGGSGSSGGEVDDGESISNEDDVMDDEEDGDWEGPGKHPSLLDFPSAVGVRGGDPSFISGKRSTNVNLLASQLAILARECDPSTGEPGGGGRIINVIESRGRDQNNSLALFDNHSLENNTIASPLYSGLDNSALRSNNLSQLEMDPEAFRIAAGLLSVEDGASAPPIQQPSSASPEALSLPLFLNGPAKLEVERVVKSPTPEPIETKAGWVKKAKLARKRFANLQAGKNRRKSLIVKLQVRVEEWEETLVRSDVPPKKILLEEKEREDEAPPVQPPSPLHKDQGEEPLEDDAEGSVEDILSDGPQRRPKAARGDGEYIARNRTGNPPAPLMALSSVRSRRRSQSLQGSVHNDSANSSKHTPSLEQPSFEQPSTAAPAPPPSPPPLTSLIPSDWSFAVIITKKPDCHKYAKIATTSRPRGRPRKTQPAGKAQEDDDFKLASWSKVMKSESTTLTKGSVRPRAASTVFAVGVESSSDDEEGYVERGPRPVSVDSGEDGDAEGLGKERMVVGRGRVRKKWKVEEGQGEGEERGGGYDEEGEYNRRWSRRRSYQ
ncbi:unnamed protein product [Tuber aestivum]|uniref:JmjC domain-containing protein n=1 Tax=Tuber aestivum TaxID=59557 RepID=A0A292Q0X1_9PEZI|nr:unnamed protein product [Tuber aestivum]